MAKGGKTTQKIEMPKALTGAAKENIELAKAVGALPYAPYFGGSVAAFQPGQMAAFENMNKAANAFGLTGSAGQGLPTPQDFGGVKGYSTQGPYEAAMAKVDPAVLELYKSFFFPHNQANTTKAASPPPPVAQPSNVYTDRNHPQYYAFGGGSRGDRR